MSQTQRGEVVVFPNAAAVANDAARRFVALAQAAIAERGRFTVALSGGSTPRAMHERLAAPPLNSAIDWERVFVYWGDERMVPPDDADSNYRMARDTLLAHVPIPAANIVPAPTVGGTPADAAIFMLFRFRKNRPTLAERAAPRLPAHATRVVRCYRCGRAFDASAHAESTSCPGCAGGISPAATR